MVQLLETPFVNLVNYASLVTTNASRHRFVAGKSKTLLEFGLRRAQVLQHLLFPPLIALLLVLSELVTSFLMYRVQMVELVLRGTATLADSMQQGWLCHLIVALFILLLPFFFFSFLVLF